MPEQVATTRDGPTPLSGAVWTASPVPDYPESPPATWRRLTAAGVWPDASRRFERARSEDDSLAEEHAKQRWLRTHYPPPQAPVPKTAAVPDGAANARPQSPVSSPPVQADLPPTLTPESPPNEVPSEPPPVRPVSSEPPPPNSILFGSESIARTGTSDGDVPRRKRKKLREPATGTKGSKTSARPMSAAQVEGVRQLHESATKRRSNFLDDLDWVYANYAAYVAGIVKPSAAPSSGAWGLMINAAANPAKFFADMRTKALKTQDEETEGKRHRDDGRKIFDLLDRLDPSGKTAGLGLVRGDAAVQGSDRERAVAT